MRQALRRILISAIAHFRWNINDVFVNVISNAFKVFELLVCTQNFRYPPKEKIFKGEIGLTTKSANIVVLGTFLKEFASISELCVLIASILLKPWIIYIITIYS